MIRTIIAFCCAACFLTAEVRALDLPIDLGFQLGFTIRVVPAPDDASRHLGLQVHTDKIRSDKLRALTVTGFITNQSGVQCDNIAMHFAVDSYLGTGYSRGIADVHPDSLPPGATARFTARINLGSESPRNAMYTITAAAHGQPILWTPEVVSEPLDVEYIDPYVFDETADGEVSSSP